MDDDHGRLAERARSGDRDALNELLELHLSLVHRYVTVKIGWQQAEVDDVVQETLISAARSIGRLRASGRPDVAGWLLGIARHKVTDHLRDRYRHPTSPLTAGMTDPAQPVEERVADLDRSERLRRALSRLTPEQVEVVVLRFVLGFDINDVARITHRPAGAVKSMQHRAIASLQQMLSAEARSGA